MPEVPPAVGWALVAIALLVLEHGYALATPPYGPHGPFFFHLSFAALYVWLGIEVWRGHGWAAVVFTVLVSTQAIGRVFVWRAERAGGECGSCVFPSSPGPPTRKTPTGRSQRSSPPGARSRRKRRSASRRHETIAVRCDGDASIRNNGFRSRPDCAG